MRDLERRVKKLEGLVNSSSAAEFERFVKQLSDAELEKLEAEMMASMTEDEIKEVNKMLEEQGIPPCPPKELR